MQNQIQVSIIMPWHNGMEYLEETLGYVRQQTFQNYELICVDDESTDGTYEKLLEEAKKDPKMVVLQQKKANAGAARNVGIRHAKGETLLFWDSDDLFEKDAVELLYRKLTEDEADVAVCDADLYEGEPGTYIATKQYLKPQYLPEELPFSIRNNGLYIFNFTSQVPWNKLYRRAFVEENQLWYQEIPRINDHFFVSMSLLLAKRITIVEKSLIHYRVNQQTNLTSHTSDTPLLKYQVQCDLKDEMVKRGLWEMEEVRRSFINKALNTLLHGLNIQNEAEGFASLFDILKREGFERLGVADYGVDYYFDPLEYNNLKLILENPYDQFLLKKYLEYRKTISRKNDELRRKNETIKEKNVLLKDLRKKESELNYIKNTKRYQIMDKATQIVKVVIGKNRKQTKK